MKVCPPSMMIGDYYINVIKWGTVTHCPGGYYHPHHWQWQQLTMSEQSSGVKINYWRYYKNFLCYILTPVDYYSLIDQRYRVTNIPPIDWDYEGFCPWNATNWIPHKRREGDSDNKSILIGRDSLKTRQTQIVCLSPPRLMRSTSLVRTQHGEVCSL